MKKILHLSIVLFICMLMFIPAIASAAPSITTPANNTTLSGPTETISWTANGTAVSSWWLWAGPCDSAVFSSCGDDYYNSGQTGSGTLSRTMSGLPTDGSTVYVRLWYNSEGWQSVLYQYTAAIGGEGSPEITSPSPGSTLSGSTEIFTWTANGTAVSSWWLWVGPCNSSVFNSCGDDYYNSGQLGSGTLSNTISGLPADGSTVFVRLWYYSGGWQSVLFQYTASMCVNCPEICDDGLDNDGDGMADCADSECDGLICDDGQYCSVDETCQSGVCMGGVVRDCSDNVNCTEDSCNEGTDSCDNVPNDVYCSDNGLFCDGFEYCDPTNDCVSGGDPCYPGNCDELLDQCVAGEGPGITIPSPGSTLSGSTEIFTWTANGTDVSSWWLWVGPCNSSVFNSCGDDYYNSGQMGSGTLSNTISGLPDDGSTVFARLWYYSGGWQSILFQYTASMCVNCPEICDDGLDNDGDGMADCADSECDGLICDDGQYCSVDETCQSGVCMGGVVRDCSDTVNCTEDSCNEGTDSCDNVPNDVYCSDNGLFCDGSEYCDPTNDCVSGGDPCYPDNCDELLDQCVAGEGPGITNPTPNSVLTGYTDTFTWRDNGSPVSGWWLWVGPCNNPASGGCGDDYYNSGSLPPSTISTAVYLPTNGATFYVRLWYNVSGVWNSVLYNYTAHTAACGDNMCDIGVSEDCSSCPDDCGSCSTVIEANQWEVVEISLTSSTSYGNPYLDVDIDAVFDSPDGTVVTVKGFWDGVNTYRVRFTPTVEGQWTYATTNNQGDPELVTSGAINVSAPLSGNKGFIRIDPQYPNSFIFDDGTRYFMFGTTAYSIIQNAMDGDLWKADIDFYASNKINKVRFFIHPLNWDLLNPPGDDQKYPDSQPFMFTSSRPDHDRLNIPHWQKLDEVIEYMASRGIVADLSLFTTSHSSTRVRTFGTDEQDMKYVRYAVARFAAYPNVIWNLINEYNSPSNIATRITKEWWGQIGNIIYESDPWHYNGTMRRPLSIHPWNTDRFDFFDESPLWPSFAILQYHGYGAPCINCDISTVSNIPDEWGNYGIVNNLSQNMPVVNDEYAYAGGTINNDGNGGTLCSSGTPPCPVFDRTRNRQTMWGIYTAGGYASMGDSYRDGMDSHEQKAFYDGWYMKGWQPWVTGDAVLTDPVLLYNDAKVLIEFFKTKGIQYWKMTSNNNLIISGNRVYALAKPGVEYVVYDATGTTFEIELDSTKNYIRYKFNPRTGAEEQMDAISHPSAPYQIISPTQQDWVYRIKAEGS